jgi:ribosomal protein L20
MALARVQLSASDFDTVYDHMRQHMPAYANMHLREACKRNKKRDLRYLHAMRVKPGTQRAIEGMICGPGILWEYELIPRSAHTQIIVKTDKASPKERRRIERQFRKEILRRVNAERAGNRGFPKLAPGQFYLRRGRAMAPNHPNCQSAIARGVLDPAFVSRVLVWNFLLLAP